MDVILKKYFWVLNLLVIGLCATLAGRATASMLVSAVLTGDGPQTPSRTAAQVPLAEGPHLKDVDAILKRNIFCSTCAPVVPTLDVRPADGPIDLTPQKSTLQLQLVATMIVPDEPKVAAPAPPKLASGHRGASAATKRYPPLRPRHGVAWTEPEGGAKGAKTVMTATAGMTATATTTATPLIATPPVITVSSGESQSMAVIRDLADDKKPVGIYRRGDALPQGAVLAQVVDGRIYIVVGKSVQYINQHDMPPPPAPAVAVAEPSAASPEASALDKDIDKGVRCSAGSCEVDKSLIDKVLANTTALATSARFVPSSKDGKPNGFKVYAIRPGSVFAKIGMQNSDLIKGINGLDMSTPDKAFEAYTKLKSASHLTVQLERQGGNITLDYQIR